MYNYYSEDEIRQCEMYLNEITDADEEVMYAGPYGFPGFFATSKGRIYGMYSGRWMTPSGCNNGYLHIRLGSGGRQIMVHRLIAAMFIPNPDNKPLVNHIDHDRHNNDVRNLEWVTHQENVLKKLEHDRKYGKPHIRVDDNTVHQICRDLESGMSTRMVAEKYGYDQDLVYSIKSGRRWKNISQHYNLSFDRYKKCQYTEEMVKSFCIMHRDFNMGTREISDLYNCPIDSVYRILNGRSWRNVTDDYFNFNDPIDKNDFDTIPNTICSSNDELLSDWDNGDDFEDGIDLRDK